MKQPSYTKPFEIIPKKEDTQTAFILSPDSVVSMPCISCLDPLDIPLRTLGSQDPLEQLILCESCGDPQVLPSTFSEWLFEALRQEGYFYHLSDKVDAVSSKPAALLKFHRSHMNKAPVAQSDLEAECVQD